MTGPEHYQEAERLAGSHPQQAQVHALLALVSAIADPLGYGGRSDSQWDGVIR